MERIRSCTVIRIRISSTWHVARIRNLMNDAYRVLDAKPEGTGTLRSGARTRLGLSGHDPVSDCCEDGNKPWGDAIIGGRFIEQLNDC